MHYRSLYPLVAGLALALWARPASAEDPRRIGIVVSVTVNVSAADANAIATELGDALRTERPVDIIAGAETDRRMPEGGLPEECVAKPECRNDIGRRLDADELLMLVIVEMGGQLQIDATWANVASGKVTSRPQIVIEPGEDRAEIFTKSVPLLIPHIKKEQPDKGPDIVIVPGGGQVTGSGRHFTAGTWIATSVAAAALVGGGIFALSAQQKFSSLDDDGCRDMPCDQGEIDSLRSRALAADVLFGIAAASTVTAVWLYMRSGGDNPTETPASPGIQVTAGPDGVALGIGGSF